MLKFKLTAKKKNLILTYKKNKNRHLKDLKNELIPGTNKIVDLDSNSGSCFWKIEDKAECYEFHWEKFWPEQRQRIEDSYFSDKIFHADDKKCVISEECTTAALDAAHLSSKKDGGDDSPFNGILLRSDLHRLFDAGLFYFDKSGRVKITQNSDTPLSCYYKALLRDKRLPSNTFHRVKYVLGQLEMKRKRQ